MLNEQLLSKNGRAREIDTNRRQLSHLWPSGHKINECSREPFVRNCELKFRFASFHSSHPFTSPYVTMNNWRRLFFESCHLRTPHRSSSNWPFPTAGPICLWRKVWGARGFWVARHPTGSDYHCSDWRPYHPPTFDGSFLTSKRNSEKFLRKTI